MVRTVGIVGLGLIGGSMAKALRRFTDCRVLAFDRDRAVVERALAEGVADGELTDEALALCDLVIVALYPRSAVEYVTRRKAFVRKGGLVMDCGGVKEPVCRELWKAAEEAGFIFVGGHPMAGIERSGYENAFAELFQGASLILTPREGTPRACVEEIWSLAKELGFARLQLSDPLQHDRLIAYTSQLAHAVSCAYVAGAGTQELGGFSAGSFRDMTRVAKLNEDMWTELFLENREPLVREIDALVEELSALSRAIDRGERQELWDMLHRARTAKERIDQDL